MPIPASLSFLHGILAFSIKREWATKNLVALVDRPRQQRFAHRRLRFLQAEELEALVRAVPDDYLGPVEAPLDVTAEMTGVRQGELIGLRWIDVDWSASRILAGELERHFHDLRLPFGTQMAATGVPLCAIQEWMGHADASTTQTYAHYAPDPTAVLCAPRRPSVSRGSVRSRSKGRAGRRPSVPQAAMTDVPSIVYEYVERSVNLRKSLS